MHAESSPGFDWAPKERTARGVAQALRQAIQEGRLKPGTKLPPIRTVARAFGMSPTTINAAWTQLVKSGAIRTDRRRGSVVADMYAGSERYRRALERNTLFQHDLATGVPDSNLLPALSPALHDLTTTALPSGYLDPPIVVELVEQLRTSWPYSADRFMIFDGAMDALDMFIRTRIRFGDRVIVEDPAFPPLLDALGAAGADIAGVPIDDEGLMPKPLAEALHTGAAAIVLQPRAQNPTGASMTPNRAQQLAEVIRPTDILIVEDDSAGAIASSPALSLGRWLPAQTVHIRSFSKSHGPDLRLAAASGATTTIQDMAARRQLGQGWSSRLLQQILLNLLQDPQAIRQIDHARDEYGRRRSAFVQALARRGVRIAGNDGFNLWVPVADETAALVHLASQGIGAAAGTPFMVSRNNRDHIRLTIAAVEHDHLELAEIVAAAATADMRSMSRY